MGKLANIIDGWSNYAFEGEDVRKMALERAEHCGKCPHAVKRFYAALVVDEIKDIEGYVCNLCSCPLSALLRSPDEKCKDNKWQAKTL